MESAFRYFVVILIIKVYENVLRFHNFALYLSIKKIILHLILDVSKNPCNVHLKIVKRAKLLIFKKVVVAFKNIFLSFKKLIKYPYIFPPKCKFF